MCSRLFCGLGIALVVVFFKQKTAYEMRISDWSSDVCSSDLKIRIVLEGLRGEDSIAELCRKEGIAQSLYYTWSKEFMEAGKRRLAGDTARAETTDEVKIGRAACRERVCQYV